MQHFVILLYFIALLSGVAWLFFLEQRYRAVKDQLIRDQRNLFLNYTVMIFLCSIISYLLVNYRESQGLMELLSVTVVLSSSPMFFLQGKMIHSLKKTPWSRKKALLYFIPVFTAPITCLVILLQKNLPLMITVLSLQLLPILLAGPVTAFHLNNVDAPKINRGVKLWQALEMGLCLGLCFLEFLFRLDRIIETGIILSLPGIYLMLNIIHYWQRDILMPYLNPGSSLQSDLTPKEQEVVTLLAQGKSNKEIAFELAISASTVKNHIYNVYRKTGAQSRVELLNILKIDPSR